MHRSWLLLVPVLASSLFACGDDRTTAGGPGPVPMGDVVDAGSVAQPDAGAAMTMMASFDGTYSGEVTLTCLSEISALEITVAGGVLTGDWGASIAGGMITATVDAAGTVTGTTTVVVRGPRGECAVAGTFLPDGTGSGTATCTDSIECTATWSVARVE